jgi:hypothetical protein
MALTDTHLRRLRAKPEPKHVKKVNGTDLQYVEGWRVIPYDYKRALAPNEETPSEMAQTRSSPMQVVAWCMPQRANVGPCRGPGLEDRPHLPSASWRHRVDVRNIRAETDVAQHKSAASRINQKPAVFDATRDS